MDQTLEEGVGRRDTEGISVRGRGKLTGTIVIAAICHADENGADRVAVGVEQVTAVARHDEDSRAG